MHFAIELVLTSNIVFFQNAIGNDHEDDDIDYVQVTSYIRDHDDEDGDGIGDDYVDDIIKMVRMMIMEMIMRMSLAMIFVVLASHALFFIFSWMS